MKNPLFLNYKRNFRKIIQSFVWKNIILQKKKDLKININELTINQYLSSDELENLNWKRRKKLVAYAFEKVPYYRKRFEKKDFHPSDLKHPDDFLKVPILRREDIRNNLDRLISTDCDKYQLMLTGTGGSTGAPLIVYKQQNDKGLSAALQVRMLIWWGIHPFTDYATAYRVNKKDYKDFESSNYGSKQPNNFNKVMQHLKDYTMASLQRRAILDPSFMNDEDMFIFFNQLRKIKPEYIVGYVGAIDELATFVENKGLTGTLNLKAVWTTAAPLSASQRFNIEKAFNCPVYDQYGSIEVFWLAAECQKRDGLHFFYDARHIEFLDKNGKPTDPNIPGDVVITDLENFAFPIIRYLNGDVGSWKGKTCSCGINLPLINNIHGRQSDKVVLPDGSSIAGEYLTTIFDDYADEVRNFQIHQVSKKRMIIKIVMAKSDRYYEIIDKVANRLRDTTKDSIEIEFYNVNEIKHDDGKFRYIISDIKN